MIPMNEIRVLIAVALPEELLEQLKALSSRIQIEIKPMKAGEEVSEDLLADVDVLYTSSFIPDLEDMPNLRWVQLHHAGINRIADHAILRSDIPVTTMSGVSAPSIAEYVLMMILNLGHRLPFILEDKASKVWSTERGERFMPQELRNSTVGIVGYGSVGREIARLCHSYGADILAVKRDLKSLEDDGYTLAGLGDPKAELVERLYPPQAIASMASLCDFLVISVPLTSQTRGMVNDKVLTGMKPSSFLLDVSSGGIVDHGALVEALTERKIAGAALDVYPVEPLPEGSPLWEMPHVFLSPHVAGNSPMYFQGVIDCFAENMKRFLSEQPLLNLFQAERGY
jgi:phosphoglycerate dehydrogenase-like enzyme